MWLNSDENKTQEEITNLENKVTKPQLPKTLLRRSWFDANEIYVYWYYCLNQKLSGITA